MPGLSLNSLLHPVFAAALAATSCAKTMQDSTPQVFAGTKVENFTGVAKHTVAITTSERTPFCSGTLIAKDLVLTAAHCAESYAHRSLVAFGLGVLRSGQVVTVSGRPVVHPDYKTLDDKYSINDIALIKLEEVPKLPPGMAPAAIADQSDFDAGSEVLIAGYGSLGFASTGRPIDNHREEMYETSTTIESLNKPYPGFITYRSANGQSSACIGDSGGPMFIRDKVTGELKVIGATRGPILEDHNSLRCIGSGTSTNAAYFKSWIDQQTS